MFSTCVGEESGESGDLDDVAFSGDGSSGALYPGSTVGHRGRGSSLLKEETGLGVQGRDRCPVNSDCGDQGAGVPGLDGLGGCCCCCRRDSPPAVGCAGLLLTMFTNVLEGGDGVLNVGGGHVFKLVTDEVSILVTWLPLLGVKATLGVMGRLPA